MSGMETRGRPPTWKGEQQLIASRARRQRLWFGGKPSSELEIMPQPRFRRWKHLRLIEAEKLVDADMEALVSLNPPRKPLKFLEAPVFLGPPQPKVPDIARAVAKFYGTTFALLVSERRTQELVTPRHVTYYLCRTMTARSMPFIAKHLGQRDHTTILHGARKIAQRILSDHELADEIDYLKEVIRGESAND